MISICYGLTAEQRSWVEDVLSNDECSTDAELLTYFMSQGISQGQANEVLSHRQDYLTNIYFTGQGPLHTS